MKKIRRFERNYTETFNSQRFDTAIYQTTQMRTRMPACQHRIRSLHQGMTIHNPRRLERNDLNIKVHRFTQISMQTHLNPPSRSPRLRQRRLRGLHSPQRRGHLPHRRGRARTGGGSARIASGKGPTHRRGIRRGRWRRRGGLAPGGGDGWALDAKSSAASAGGGRGARGGGSPRFGAGRVPRRRRTAAAAAGALHGHGLV